MEGDRNSASDVLPGGGLIRQLFLSRAIRGRWRDVRSVPGDELSRHAHVGLSAHGSNVVDDNRLAEAGRLGQSDISRNDRVVHLAAEIFASVGGNLAGQVQSGVVHGEKDAFDL